MVDEREQSGDGDAPETRPRDDSSQDVHGAEPPAETFEEVRRLRDEYQDQLQRTRAEFLNYQKRARSQADADRQYAVGALAADLLNVLDNFERAVDAARSSGADSIVAGLDMVSRQFLETLAKHGIEPIQALGRPFDPNEHEALVQQPAADQPEGTVVAELGRGYRIKDRVLRPTKVAVSIRPVE